MEYYLVLLVLCTHLFCSHGQDPPSLIIDWDECGVTKGCYRSPEDCSPSDCDVLVSWRDNGDNVTYEILREVDIAENYWVALGLSETTGMFPASVISCLYPSGSDAQVEVSFNDLEGTFPNAPLSDSTLGIVSGSVAGGVVDGKSICIFSRVKSVPEGTPEGELVYDLTPPLEYYFLLAFGPLDENGGKSFHLTTPITTPERISVDKIDNLGGNFVEPMLKAHASLMLMAWTIFSGIGILNARYFKNAWDHLELFGLKIWFVIHRVAMTLVFALTLTGFIVVFVHVGGYRAITSPSPSILGSHPILGIIIMICVTINPIMAMFRPGPKDAKRPIFNWGHRIVGESGRLLSVFNLMTGINLASASNFVEDWMLWAMVGLVCFHVIIEGGLMLRMFAKQKKQQGIGSTDAINMDSKSELVTESTSHVLETAALAVYGVVVTSLTLAIVIRIAIA